MLAAPPPAHTGRIASSEERGFPQDIRHVRACVSQDRGSARRPHTGQGEHPATILALPLEGPSVGYPCGPSPGLLRRPVSPFNLGSQDDPICWGDLTPRVSRGHPLLHDVGQRRERVSGVRPPFSATSWPARA